MWIWTRLSECELISEAAAALTTNLPAAELEWYPKARCLVLTSPNLKEVALAFRSRGLLEQVRSNESSDYLRVLNPLQVRDIVWILSSHPDRTSSSHPKVVAGVLLRTWSPAYNGHARQSIQPNSGSKLSTSPTDWYEASFWLKNTLDWEGIYSPYAWSRRSLRRCRSDHAALMHLEPNRHTNRDANHCPSMIVGQFITVNIIKGFSPVKV